MKILNVKSVITNFNINLRLDKIESEIDYGLQTSTFWEPASGSSFNVIYDIHYSGNSIHGNDSILKFASRLICTFIPENLETDTDELFKIVRNEHKKMQEFIEANTFIDALDLNLDLIYQPDHLQVNQIRKGLNDLSSINVNSSGRAIRITDIPSLVPGEVKINKV